MIYPTFEELSQNGKYNRYTVAMAAAKGAKLVTEEYLEEREYADQMVQRKETDKPLMALIDEELRDEKAVRTSVHRLSSGEYIIKDPDEKTADDAVGEDAEQASVKEAE